MGSRNIWYLIDGGRVLDSYEGGFGTIPVEELGRAQRRVDELGRPVGLWLAVLFFGKDHDCSGTIVHDFRLGPGVLIDLADMVVTKRDVCDMAGLNRCGVLASETGHSQALVVMAKRLHPVKAVFPAPAEQVNHPGHYGGDSPHETIKCLKAWGLEADALTWNAGKYISRAFKKGDPAENLKKAAFYTLRKVAELEGKDPGYYNDALKSGVTAAEDRVAGQVSVVADFISNVHSGAFGNSAGTVAGLPVQPAPGVDKLPSLEAGEQQEEPATCGGYSRAAMERLASLEHDSWAGWTRYMVERVMEELEPASQFTGLDCVKRWRRQCETDYADLSGIEQASDMRIVKEKLPVYRAVVRGWPESPYGQTPHQARVEEMSRAFGQEVPAVPTANVSKKTRLLRARLILEEAMETIWRGLGVEVVMRRDEDYMDLSKSLDSNGSYDAARALRFAYGGLECGRCVTDIAKFDFSVAHGGDLVQLADGCADLSVVTIGTLSAYGIKDRPLLEEVDANNMLKVSTGHTDPVTGKFIKPEDHPAPDIAGVLRRQAPEEVS